SAPIVGTNPIVPCSNFFASCNASIVFTITISNPSLCYILVKFYLNNSEERTLVLEILVISNF
ncbi:MAG: hypothetical protein L3J43_10000, partial [Sulfurovum sp.]|nr:hypothetical protein [Sulfurovum sp.]